MPEQGIEKTALELLAGDAQRNALAFISCLRASDLLIERLSAGYWADKYYWGVTYQKEFLFFILINGSADIPEPLGWTVWSDDSGSNWFEDFPLDEETRALAWEYVDVCADCGGCNGGGHKSIFGKAFDNVCRTTFRFENPDKAAVECMIKLMEIRKSDIQKNM